MTTPSVTTTTPPTMNTYFDQLVETNHELTHFRQEITTRITELETDMITACHQQDQVISRVEGHLAVLQKKIRLLEDDMDSIQKKYHHQQHTEYMESLFIITLFLSIVVSVVTHQIFSPPSSPF